MAKNENAKYARYQINDGQYIPAFFEGDEWHPDTRIKYRPMLNLERLAIFEEIQPMTTIEGEKRIMLEIAERVNWWDIAGDDGERLPITVASVEIIEPRLAGKIGKTILGHIPPVKWPEDDKEPPTREEMEGNSEAG
jgi:hypothetical protein